MEDIKTGWLTKSPPGKYVQLPFMKKRSFSLPFKTNWRKRFFVLSKPINGSLQDCTFVYYEDEKRHKRLGKINLVHLKSVHSTVESSLYAYLFSLEIVGDKSRTYHLAAETQAERDDWVRHLESIHTQPSSRPVRHGSPSPERRLPQPHSPPPEPMKDTEETASIDSSENNYQKNIVSQPFFDTVVMDSGDKESEIYDVPKHGQAKFVTEEEFEGESNYDVPNKQPPPPPKSANDTHDVIIDDIEYKRNLDDLYQVPPIRSPPPHCLGGLHQYQNASSKTKPENGPKSFRNNSAGNSSHIDLRTKIPANISNTPIPGYAPMSGNLSPYEIMLNGDGLSDEYDCPKSIKAVHVLMPRGMPTSLASGCYDNAVASNSYKERADDSIVKLPQRKCISSGSSSSASSPDSDYESDQKAEVPIASPRPSLTTKSQREIPSEYAMAFVKKEDPSYLPGQNPHYMNTHQ